MPQIRQYSENIRRTFSIEFSRELLSRRGVEWGSGSGLLARVCVGFGVSAVKWCKSVGCIVWSVDHDAA